MTLSYALQSNQVAGHSRPNLASVSQNVRLQRVQLRVQLALVALGPAFRRGIDIVVAGAALIVLSPVLLAAAIAIKLTSPGSVLFRQERIGHHGQRFGM